MRLLPHPYRSSLYMVKGHYVYVNTSKWHINIIIILKTKINDLDMINFRAFIQPFSISHAPVQVCAKFHDYNSLQ